MALDGIEVFVEVVDAGSFTKAAKRLAIPLSTASAKVARLEETLSVTLLQRTTRQLHVTEVGQVYYEYCVRALGEMAEAEQLIGDAISEPRGTLRITAPVDIAQFVLVDVVNSFLDAYPHVSVDLVVTNRKVDLIAEGIDLAVRVGPLEDSNLIARKFLESRIGLFATESYLEKHGWPRDANDLSNHRIIWISLARNRPKLLDELLEKINAPSEGRIASDDISSIRAFVQSGTCIGLLPEFAAQSRDGYSNLKKVLPQLSSIPTLAYFVYPEQRFVPPKVKAFLEHASK